MDISLDDIAKVRKVSSGRDGRDGRGRGRGRGRGGGGRATRGGKSTGAGKATKVSGGKQSGAGAKIFKTALGGGDGGRGRASRGRASRGGRATRGGRGAGGAGRGAARERRNEESVVKAKYVKGNADGKSWSHDLFEGGSRGGKKTVQRTEVDLRSQIKSKPLYTGTKVLIKNLAEDVTKEDMQELCQTIGELKEIVKSKVGVTATFKKKADAETFKAKYDTVPLDGQPMQIIVVTNKAAGLAGRLGAPTKFTISL